MSNKYSCCGSAQADLPSFPFSFSFFSNSAFECSLSLLSFAFSQVKVDVKSVRDFPVPVGDST